MKCHRSIESDPAPNCHLTRRVIGRVGSDRALTREVPALREREPLRGLLKDALLHLPEVRQGHEAGERSDVMSAVRSHDNDRRK